MSGFLVVAGSKSPARPTSGGGSLTGWQGDENKSEYLGLISRNFQKIENQHRQEANDRAKGKQKRHSVLKVSDSTLTDYGWSDLLRAEDQSFFTATRSPIRAISPHRGQSRSPHRPDSSPGVTSPSLHHGTLLGKFFGDGNPPPDPASRMDAILAALEAESRAADEPIRPKASKRRDDDVRKRKVKPEYSDPRVSEYPISAEGRIRDRKNQKLGIASGKTDHYLIVGPKDPKVLKFQRTRLEHLERELHKETILSQMKVKKSPRLREHGRLRKEVVHYNRSPRDSMDSDWRFDQHLLRGEQVEQQQHLGLQAFNHARTAGEGKDTEPRWNPKPTDRGAGKSSHVVSLLDAQTTNDEVKSNHDFEMEKRSDSKTEKESIIQRSRSAGPEGKVQSDEHSEQDRLKARRPSKSPISTKPLSRSSMPHDNAAGTGTTTLVPISNGPRPQSRGNYTPKVRPSTASIPTKNYQPDIDHEDIGFQVLSSKASSRAVPSIKKPRPETAQAMPPAQLEAKPTPDRTGVISGHVTLKTFQMKPFQDPPKAELEEDTHRLPTKNQRVASTKPQAHSPGTERRPSDAGSDDSYTQTGSREAEMLGQYKQHLKRPPSPPTRPWSAVPGVKTSPAGQEESDTRADKRPHSAFMAVSPHIEVYVGTIGTVQTLAESHNQTPPDVAVKVASRPVSRYGIVPGIRRASTPITQAVTSGPQPEPSSVMAQVKITSDEGFIRGFQHESVNRRPEAADITQDLTQTSAPWESKREGRREREADNGVSVTSSSGERSPIDDEDDTSSSSFHDSGGWKGSTAGQALGLYSDPEFKLRFDQQPSHQQVRYMRPKRMPAAPYKPKDRFQLAIAEKGMDQKKLQRAIAHAERVRLPTSHSTSVFWLAGGPDPPPPPPPTLSKRLTQRDLLLELSDEGPEDYEIILSPDDSDPRIAASSSPKHSGHPGDGGEDWIPSIQGVKKPVRALAMKTAEMSAPPPLSVEQWDDRKEWQRQLLHKIAAGSPSS